MPLPRPVKSLNFTTEENKELYVSRVSDDERLNDLDTLLSLGERIFHNAANHNIIQPFSDQKIDLNKDFWDFKMINGLQSLKRGFFKIVKEPAERDLKGIKTWAAYVLYNTGNNLNEHYLYYANVGTIVNRYAICFNLKTNDSVLLPHVNEKEAFLKSMVNKTFYVSRAEFVEDLQFAQMKEVLWFMLT